MNRSATLSRDALVASRLAAYTNHPQSIVMPGLELGICQFSAPLVTDGRVKPGHDEH